MGGWGERSRLSGIDFVEEDGAGRMMPGEVEEDADEFFTFG